MNEKFFYDLQHIAMNGFFNSLTEFQFPDLNNIIIDIEDIVSFNFTLNELNFNNVQIKADGYQMIDLIEKDTLNI